LAIHPTAGEIVAATHWWSLWVLDVTPRRQAVRVEPDPNASYLELAADDDGGRMRTRCGMKRVKRKKAGRSFV
jgi:hypothetical protein